MPNDQVRTILHTIVTQYGPFDSGDASQRRCRGLLRDLASGYTLEVNLLLFALAIGAPEELAARRDNLDVAAPRLVHRLQETQGTSEENAVWSIDVWQFVLGLGGAEATRKQEEAAALPATMDRLHVAIVQVLKSASEVKRKQQAPALVVEQERQRIAAEQARQAAEAERKRQEAAALAADQERQRVAADLTQRAVAKHEAEKQPKQETRAELVQRLRTIMQDRHCPAKERLDAGLRLSGLGVLPEGLDDFIAVPGTDFRIGKYPLTNVQFRRFVDGGGYWEGRRPPWWSERGWKKRQEWGWTAPRWWDDARFNRATQPVVAISWYEAEAYCAWLTHVCSVPSGYRAQLPTREQWMLAARNGRKKVPAPKVDYPWGGGFDPALANTTESGLGQTTPVDMYPDGATKAAVYDLAGNVWEWTGDRYKDYDGAWWIKGGSSWSGADSAKAPAAARGNVRLWAIYGFRVVVVPISRSA